MRSELPTGFTSKGDTSEAFMEKVAKDIKDINI